MKKNMGIGDRAIRLVITIVLVALYFSGSVTGTLGLILLIGAAVFTLTSVISYCPLYTVLGINTCRIKSA